MKQPWDATGALESLAELVAYVDAPLVLVDAAGVVRAATERIASGLGYSTPCEVLGRPAEELGLSLGPHAGPKRQLRELAHADGSSRRASAHGARLGDATLVYVEWEETAPDRVAALAHDLRSPLCGVIGFSRLAREELARGNTARAVSFLERIERFAGTLQALIESAADPTHQPLADVTRVVEEIRAERKQELDRKGVRLVTPLDAPALACAPGSLHRVLSNLIDNAIDHMGDPVDATICVEVRCGGDVATLTVRDNGVGIPRSECERVFAAGHSSAHAASERPRGLGLAIVRDLAARWGGRAWVESIPGEGAAVHVTIPIAR
ncbi:MAG: HAMP domain-containing histidine kinase [Deltaproteobacteria bacterium]|nr:HAMP domain-containing histidine kinase [Deltaproteobacteria bacterium]